MSGAPGLSIRWAVALLVAAKELRDTLRDRRTLLMMVLVPMLLYPLGGIVVAQLTASTMARLDREGYDIALQGGDAAARAEARALLTKDAGLRAHEVSDVARALQSGAAAAGLVLSEVPVRAAALPAREQRQLQLEVVYDSTSARSRAALDRVRKPLDAAAAGQRAARLRLLGLSEPVLNPLRVTERSVASQSRAAVAAVAPAIGILLILLSLMGAFYPAIDLIAGERERGTLEPLLTTPASRAELLTGKYLCLAVLALLTCALNLLAMGLTTGFLLSKVAGAQALVTRGRLLLLFVGTVPVLLLVSALLLLAAVFARTFKDAQNLMTPVYLLCLLPAFGGLLPEVHLTPQLAAVPVLSAVLFIKDALIGTLTLGPAFLSVSTGLLYAACGIALSAYVFERPELLGARAGGDGPALLVERVGRAGQRALTLTGALGVFGVCLALLIYVGTQLQLWNVRLGLLVTQVALLLAPVLLAVLLGRLPLREALGLHPVSARQLLGGAVTGLGGLSGSLLLAVFLVMPVLQPPEEYLRALQALTPRTPLERLVMLGLAAVLPALCEEALCRGLLLQAARRTLGDRLAVVLSGLCFAVLHLDPYRFLNTLLIGGLLAVVAVRAGSLWPAVLMHFINNAAALLIGDSLFKEGAARGPGQLVALLVVALVATPCGLWLVKRVQGKVEVGRSQPV